MKEVRFAADPEARKLFRKWIEDPLTIEILQTVQLEGVIVMPSAALFKSEYALVAMGGNIAWNQCIERIRNLDAPTTATPTEPVPLYGAEELMKQEYNKEPPQKV